MAEGRVMTSGARQEMDNRRVALWLRVSTDEQTVENQRMQLNDLAGMRGWSVVKEYDLSGLSAWQNSLQGQVTKSHYRFSSGPLRHASGRQHRPADAARSRGDGWHHPAPVRRRNCPCVAA